MINEKNIIKQPNMTNMHTNNVANVVWQTLADTCQNKTKQKYNISCNNNHIINI